MYPSQFPQIIQDVVSTLMADFEQSAPFMAQQAIPWMHELSGSATPADYFLHPQAFPSLLLPWWCEATYHPTLDLTLQRTLAYSTINGYYYIRLIDDLMDGDTVAEVNLLPTLNFFHTKFLVAYQQYFPATHPFWPAFQQIWYQSGSVSMQDAQLTDLTLLQFKQIAAQKICAAKIPLLAVCYHYQQTEAMETWLTLVDRLGCWHQMLNDLFDWHKDLHHGNSTFFLAEGARCKSEDESLAMWVINSGFEWGVELLNEWLIELQALAKQLNQPELISYLQTREQMFKQRVTDAQAGFTTLANLFMVMGS